MNDELLQEIVKDKQKLKFVRSIDALNCSELTDKSLHTILKNCKHVEEINLRGCSKISSKALINFSMLKSIKTMECPILSHAAITVMTTLRQDVDFGEEWIRHCSADNFLMLLKNVSPPRCRLESRNRFSACWVI